MLIESFRCTCDGCGKEFVITEPTKKRTFMKKWNAFMNSHVWRCEMNAKVAAEKVKAQAVVTAALAKAGE